MVSYASVVSVAGLARGTRPVSRFDFRLALALAQRTLAGLGPASSGRSSRRGGKQPSTTGQRGRSLAADWLPPWAAFAQPWSTKYKVFVGTRVAGDAEWLVNCSKGDYSTKKTVLEKIEAAMRTCGRDQQQRWMGREYPRREKADELDLEQISIKVEILQPDFVQVPDLKTLERDYGQQIMRGTWGVTIYFAEANGAERKSATYLPSVFVESFRDLQPALLSLAQKAGGGGHRDYTKILQGARFELYASAVCSSDPVAGGRGEIRYPANAALEKIGLFLI